MRAKAAKSLKRKYKAWCRRNNVEYSERAYEQAKQRYLATPKDKRHEFGL